MTTEGYKVDVRQVVIKPVKRIKFDKISAHSGTGTSFEGAQMDSATGYYKTGLSTSLNNDVLITVSLAEFNPLYPPYSFK